MDIYDYIPSPDVAAHCRKLSHPFNPLEMAVLVAISEKTLRERHDAWREILREQPDMPIHESLNFRPRSSLHECLRETIAREENLLNDFLLPGDGVVYGARAFSPNRWEHEHVDGCFSTFEKAFENVGERWDWEEDGLKYAEIRREVTDSPDQWQSVRVNSRGEVLLFMRDFLEDWYTRLDMIFIHIPVPFEKGDIVTIDGERPYVLSNMAHWNKGYEDYITGKRGDGTDMIAGCYMLAEGGSLTWDNGPPFMTYQLRYYTPELKGQACFLEYLSHYLEGGEGVEWLFDAWNKFYAEAQSEKANEYFSRYIPLEKSKRQDEKEKGV